VEAKALLAEAGVPMLPSWTEPDQVTDFPVLVKASAGGGGRGMRVVRSGKDLRAAMEAASREAGSAFGDDTVFCERYVEAGRHIEVQVVADNHGAVVALGERECSIQRRHQKIVEESPSPAVDDELRAALCDAAVAAARAVGYVGAGTVEFLLAPDGAFYFLEMNTRLQVEHPVTECVTGLDLVRLQLLVADGQPLPFTDPPPTRGHAIEVRLYAEDPGQDWRPATGTLHRFAIAGQNDFGILHTQGIRVDSAVGDGSVVGVNYDPMLAKVISWAPTRREAAWILANALARAELHGVVTNRDLLVRVLRDPEFLDGGTDTAYLGRHPEVFVPLVATEDEQRLALLAAVLASTVDTKEWGALPSGWRNVVSAPQRVEYEAPWGPAEVTYRLNRAGALEGWPDVALIQRAADRVVLEIAGIRRTFRVHRNQDWSFVDSSDGSVALREKPRFAPPAAEQAPGSLLAPMPAAVGRIAVALGDPVARGDLLLTLEAMKMEHAVHAPEAGIITALPVEPGQQVEPGTVLAVITPQDPTDRSDGRVFSTS
jgi:propionyl-CoA carboxylase alpha chain